MPFGFLRRARAGPPAEPAPEEAGPAGPGGGRSVPFDGLTEEWRLVGRMHIEGRLSDALNRRQSISLSDVRWAPADGSRPLEPAPGVRSVDPYDLIVVLTGQGSLPPDSRDERGAHRVRKVPYDVLLDAPPFQVVGTVHLYPGTEPDRLLDRATEMFVALTDAVALYGGREIEAPGSDVVLVNRFYLRGVEQVDKRTREKVRPLPGQPLGGTSWRERS